MSKLSELIDARPIRIRRVVLWIARTAGAGFITGLVVGVGISVLFGRAPFWAYLLAWGLGSGVGLSAGIASGLLSSTLAVILRRREPLSRWGSAGAACVGTLAGTLLVLGVVYGFDISQNERGFVAFVTLLAASVSAIVNRHTDSDAWFRERPL